MYYSVRPAKPNLLDVLLMLMLYCCDLSSLIMLGYDKVAFCSVLIRSIKFVAMSYEITSHHIDITIRMQTTQFNL